LDTSREAKYPTWIVAAIGVQILFALILFGLHGLHHLLGDDSTPDLTPPLVVEAVNHLKVRSCLIDGEVVCCDAQGVTAFHLLRQRRNEPQARL